MAGAVSTRSVWRAQKPRRFDHVPHAALISGPSRSHVVATNPGVDFQEELEYVAMMHAARASLRLLAADPAAPRRRVVIAADVPEDKVRHDLGFDEPTVVQITAPVPLDRVGSGHIDDPEAMEDVASAVAALDAADAGDQDAQFVVDGAEGHELEWFATQELQYLEG